MKYYTSTTQFNCGIDLHARQMYVCLMDRDGKKLVHTNASFLDQSFIHRLTICSNFLRQAAPIHGDLVVICGKRN